MELLKGGVGVLELLKGGVGMLELFVLVPLLGNAGVAGQSASWRFEPLKPPIRVCTSHMPEGVPEVARFHSMRIAPG